MDSRGLLERFDVFLEGRDLGFGDCLALAATEEELALVRPWIEQRDAHLDWPTHVQSTLASLAEKLGHRV
jgi:hypothetical protein